MLRTKCVCTCFHSQFVAVYSFKCSFWRDFNLFSAKKTKEEISSVVSQEAPFYTRNRRSALKEKKTNMAPTNNGT